MATDEMLDDILRGIRPILRRELVLISRGHKSDNGHSGRPQTCRNNRKDLYHLLDTTLRKNFDFDKKYFNPQGTIVRLYYHHELFSNDLLADYEHISFEPNLDECLKSYKETQIDELPLTKAHMRNLLLYRRGYSLRKVADVLSLSCQTARNHSLELRGRLGVNNRRLEDTRQAAIVLYEMIRRDFMDENTEGSFSDYINGRMEKLEERYSLMN